MCARNTMARVHAAVASETMQTFPPPTHVDFARKCTRNSCTKSVVLGSVFMRLPADIVSAPLRQSDEQRQRQRTRSTVARKTTCSLLLPNWTGFRALAHIVCSLWNGADAQKPQQYPKTTAMGRSSVGDLPTPRLKPKRGVQKEVWGSWGRSTQ